MRSWGFEQEFPTPSLPAILSHNENRNDQTNRILPAGRKSPGIQYWVDGTKKKERMDKRRIAPIAVHILVFEI